MKGWLLVLGISWWCCGLLKLKFHSEVVFVCFFGNYFHYGDSVSAGKGIGRGLPAHAVLSSGSVICCDHLLFAYLQTFHIRGASGGDWQQEEEQSRRIQKTIHRTLHVQWNGSDFLSVWRSPDLSPWGLGTYHGLTLTFLEEVAALCPARFALHSTRCQISGLDCSQRVPN